jgi:hypothetical protein
LISVVCVRGVGSLWIIFCSIMRLQVLYGVLFSAMLGLLELCLEE